MSNLAQDLQDILDRSRIAPECETVEFADEERTGPDDLVVFKNKNGTVVMGMPLKVYQKYCELAKP